MNSTNAHVDRVLTPHLASIGPLAGAYRSDDVIQRRPRLTAATKNLTALADFESQIVMRLPITPIPWTPLRVCYGNDMDSILAVTEDKLKRELPHTARAMSVVDLNESFRIGFDVIERNVDCDTEIVRRSGTAFRIPVCRCFQLSGRFGMETNSHRRHRAS